MNYDPNRAYNMTIQKVKLVFGRHEYRKIVETIVGGNCLGFTVIEAAIENIYDDLETEDDIPKITLSTDDGNTLELSDEMFEGSDWLKNLVISATIISIEKE